MDVFDWVAVYVQSVFFLATSSDHTETNSNVKVYHHMLVIIIAVQNWNLD